MSISLATAPATRAMTADTPCQHCGLPAGGSRFCCPGCEAAFATIHWLGLGSYYAKRVQTTPSRALRPEAGELWDFPRYVQSSAAGQSLTCAIDGLACGACVWLIESVLREAPAVTSARVNMTTSRLHLVWQGDADLAAELVGRITRLGYRLVPFDPALLRAAEDRTGQALMRALAVAGFAAANVMFLSIGTWAGLTQNMGPATRALLHWVSALIALPAIAYAGLPFFRSGWVALRHGRSNMDVPISLGVLIVTAVSVAETVRGGRHIYFDSAVTLLFFLLVGRVLDHAARGRARDTARQLMMLRAGDVAVLQADGSSRRCRAADVRAGDRVLVGAGERVGVDGTLEAGAAMLDASLVTGESHPARPGIGSKIFAGSVNLGDAITLLATATGEGTLLAECVRLIEAAEAGRGRFVVLADRVARFYAPIVHVAALSTFLVWYAVLGRPAMACLLTAASVLMITCPCALALAVPAVQVIVTQGLFRQNILLKSGTALERLAAIDAVVFDKTGTLTEPSLVADPMADPADIELAAGLAANSLHPLCRALLAAAGPAPVRQGVREIRGQGLEAADRQGVMRLGSRGFCGLPEAPAETPELWFSRPGAAPLGFRFSEQPRPGAAATVALLRAGGLKISIASGDAAAPVRAIAAALGIADFAAGLTPPAKVALLEARRAGGTKILMVGDGLNDGPSLAAADVSAAPTSAADISQTVADIVFGGASLAPIATAWRAARRAQRITRQNIGLAISYNAIMVPLAMAGFVTPWVAALAMSSSSLVVIGNSFRAKVDG